MNVNEILKKIDKRTHSVKVELWRQFLTEKMDDLKESPVKYSPLTTKSDNHDKLIVHKNLDKYISAINPNVKIFNKTVENRRMEVTIWKDIVLPNVTISRIESSFYQVQIDVRTIDFTIINNLPDFILKINDDMPQWRTEFSELCKNHKSLIEQKVREIMHHDFFNAYRSKNLVYKYIFKSIDDYLLLKQIDPDSSKNLMLKIAENKNQKIKISGKDTQLWKYDLENTSIIFQNSATNLTKLTHFIWFNGYRFYIYDTKMSIDDLKELDKLIPI